jgi:hypothetical protein
MRRQCGDCQLCCKLLPVRSIHKKAGERCRHQKFGKGCAVYHKPGMPFECAVWNCRWLVNDDTADLPRPDRAHYVIDLMPDYVTHINNETGERQAIQVVQIWVDPKHPEARHDPALRRYMFRRAQEGIAAIIRFSDRIAVAIFAPPFDAGGKWHEITRGIQETTHAFTDIVQALGGKARMVVTP